MKQFLTLDKAWQNKKQNNIDQCYAEQVNAISFKPKLRNRIDSVQMIAITAVVINTPLPTMSPITNPIIYKGITKKLSTHKIQKFFDKLKMKFLRIEWDN